MRGGVGGVLMGLMLGWAGLSGALAQTPQCSKTDFETVVDEAAAALSDLTRHNTPVFQSKLRQLKDKRGWSNDQYLKEAEPFVRDSTIVDYDQKSAEFLARITSGGQSGAASGPPDCALLSELRATMASLVELQKAKWAYMVDKIDKELGK